MPRYSSYNSLVRHEALAGVDSGLGGVVEQHHAERDQEHSGKKRGEGRV